MGEFRCYGSARGERVDFSGVYLADFRVFFHGFFGKECKGSKASRESAKVVIVIVGNWDEHSHHLNRNGLMMDEEVF